MTHSKMILSRLEQLSDYTEKPRNNPRRMQSLSPSSLVPSP
jgi:hypothetical protein